MRIAERIQRQLLKFGVFFLVRAKMRSIDEFLRIGLSIGSRFGQTLVWPFV